MSQQTHEIVDDARIEGDVTSPPDPMLVNPNQEPEGSNPRRTNLNPQIGGNPPVLMSNTELFDQIAYMGNTINSMAARMETLERERRFMMGSQEDRYNSISERYQFGYDPRYRPEDSLQEDRRMTDRGSPRPPTNHRPGKEP